jgi:hypothetical protein
VHPAIVNVDPNASHWARLIRLNSRAGVLRLGVESAPQNGQALSLDLMWYAQDAQTS